jgi:hypothetical protein
MNNEPNTLTRREALLRALQGTVAASLAVPLVSTGAEPPVVHEPEYVLENDYPFFGWEPKSAA